MCMWFMCVPCVQVYTLNGMHMESENTLGNGPYFLLWSLPAVCPNTVYYRVTDPHVSGGSLLPQLSILL